MNSTAKYVGTRLHNFFIGISEGRIEISAPGMLSTDDPFKFDTDEEAAAYLAKAMVDTGVSRLLNSSSCDFPEEDGRPDFDMDRFEQLVRSKLIAMATALEANPGSPAC